MDFSIYKSKIRILRIIGALLLTLATVGTVFGVLNLLARLELIKLNIFVLLLAVITVGAVTFAASYLLLRMPGKKLARRLDEDFALSERVQTTFEYGSRSEPIYELQRADTEAALSKIEPKMLGLRGLPIYICCAVIGVALTITSFFFKKEEPIEIPPEDPPFAITSIQEAAVLELIEYVGSSEMTSPYREEVVAELSNMLSGLREATLTSQKNSCLSSALKNIYDVTDSSSFTLELIEELYARDSQPLKELAKALNYYSYAETEEWEDFSDGLTLFRVAFIHADVLSDSPDPDKMSAETKALLTSAVSGLNMAFTRAGMSSTDATYIILKKLFEDGETGFGALAKSELDYESLQAALDGEVASINTELFDVILANKTNTDTGEYAMKRIASIFSYPCPSFERPKLRDISQNGAGGSDSESGGGQGAIGSGTVFGSDDLVLDPNTDEYVEYGTVISRYYEIIFGKLEGDSYTEEEKAALEKYFKILYGTAND